MNAEFTFTATVEEYGARLRERGGVLDEAIEAKLNELTARLLMSIQQKLSGEVLQQRTGTLLRSVEMQAAEFVGAICNAVVGIDDNAPSFKYAAAFEFGGLTEYEIVPHNALALAFIGAEGNMIFRRKVIHPPAKKLPFIAPSVEEMREPFLAEMKAVLDTVLGGDSA